MALLLSHFCLAQQKIISLHPLIGDTITYEEAYDFYLLHENDIKSFDYAIIIQEHQDYTVYFYGDSARQASIDSLQIAQYHQNIEKLWQYTLQSRAEQNKSLDKDTSVIQSVDLNLMTLEQKKKMIKDARLYNHKKLNADEWGLMGNEREDYMNYSGGYIWSPVKKKDK